jgi:hypothetical protein
MTSGTMPISIKTPAAPSAAITVKSENLISERPSLSLGAFPQTRTGFPENYSFEFRQAGSVFLDQPVGKEYGCNSPLMQLDNNFR